MPVVKVLTLEGTRQVDEGVIEDGIATTATGWWWPFAKKKYFDPFTWSSDLLRIERIYEARGFYQARVLADRIEEREGGVALTAVIEEGQPTVVGSLSLHGLESLSSAEREHVLADLRLEGRFEERRWEDAKQTIETRVRNLGYARAAVSGRALVEVDSRTAALDITVALGPLCRFGEIRIDQGAAQGARPRIVPLWIWEQVRLAVADGELYSDDGVAEAQRRLVAMGVFSVAKVSVGDPDPVDHRMPVLVVVREAPLRLVRTGGGLKIDQVRNEARGLFEWSHLDFLGAMRRLTFRGELGWAFIPNVYATATNQISAGARNGPIARARLELEQPRLLGRPSLRGTSSAQLERTLEQAYDSLGAKLSAGVAWRPWTTWTVQAAYHLQGAYLNGPAIASVSAAPLTLGCATAANDCFVLLSYLEQIVAWDKRDFPLAARHGFLVSLALQEGGGPLGGDFAYLRILPELRGYVSFGERDAFTLGARVRAGQLLHGSPQSAVVTRFFAGGGVSMRGFSDRRLSPLLLAPPPSTQLGTPNLLTLPIGGNGMVEASIELRWQLSEKLIWAVFVDGGQVTRDWLRPSDLRTMLWAAGMGLRYRTPIGPIRVDIARRLPWGRLPPLLALDLGSGVISEQPYAARTDCFGIGGSRGGPVSDGACVFHIAIGEAF